jgi:hypothetical protein
LVKRRGEGSARGRAPGPRPCLAAGPADLVRGIGRGRRAAAAAHRSWGRQPRCRRGAAASMGSRREAVAPPGAARGGGQRVSRRLARRIPRRRCVQQPEWGRPRRDRGSRRRSCKATTAWGGTARRSSELPGDQNRGSCLVSPNLATTVGEGRSREGVGVGQPPREKRGMGKEDSLGGRRTGGGRWLGLAAGGWG